MSSCGPAAQPGLPFDDAVGQAQLATKRVQKEHSLSEVYCMGDYYQLSLLVLHQGGDHIDQWLGGLFAIRPFLSMGGQLCLWPVLTGKLRHLGSCFVVQDLGELINGRGYLEPLIDVGPLLLKPYRVGPFDKASEVPFGLDVLSNAKVVTPFNR